MAAGNTKIVAEGSTQITAGRGGEEDGDLETLLVTGEGEGREGQHGWAERR
jgi:hypothetical protein